MRAFGLVIALVTAVAVLGCSQKAQEEPTDRGKKGAPNKDVGKRPIDDIAKMPKHDPAKEEKLAAERGKRRLQLAAQERGFIPTLAKAHPAGETEKAIARLGDKFYHEIAFSPDGKLAATAADQDIYIWDLPTGTTWRKLSVKPPNDFVSALRFGKDRRTLVAIVAPIKDINKSTIIVWDVENEKELKKVDRDSLLGVIAISPDGKRLAVGNGSLAIVEHPVDVLDLDTLELKYSLPAVRHLQAIAFSPCGKFLATGGRNEVILRDATNGKKFTEVSTPAQVGELAFSPDGWTLMISDYETHREGGRLIRWHLESGKDEKLLDLASLTRTLAYSPDGKLLAVFESRSKACTIRDARTAAVVQELPADPGAFSPGGQLFVVPGRGLLFHLVKEKKNAR
jgi:WD40 repeat protein